MRGFRFTWLAAVCVAVHSVGAHADGVSASVPVVDPALAGGDPITGAGAGYRVAFVVEVGASADALGAMIDVFLAHDMTASLFVVRAEPEPLREQLQRAAAQGFAIGLDVDPAASPRAIDASVHALAIDVEGPIGLVTIRGASAGRAGLTLVRPTLDLGTVNGGRFPS